MNSDTMEEAIECAKETGAITKCSNCYEHRAANDEIAEQKAVELALRQRDEQHRGFRGMSDAEVREAVESAIQDAGDCRCRRFE